MRDGRSGLQASGIEGGERGVVVVEDEGKFGATEDDSIATVIVLKAGDDFEESREIIGGVLSKHQAVEDDGVDEFPFFQGWSKGLNSERGELVRVNRAFHEVLGPQDGEAPEVAIPGGVGDHLGDVEPGKVRIDCGVIHRLVDRVVGADRELRPHGGELLGRFGEKFADGRPVALLEESNMFTEAEGMKDNLGVVMRAEMIPRLGGDGLETESCTRSAAGSDSDRVGLGPGV